MGVKVVDKNAQQEVEVGSAEAQRGFQEGRYVVPTGPVKIARDAHTTGTVQAEDLDVALAQGWRVVDDQEQAALTVKREESGAAGLAVGSLEALAAGATLGGSTWLTEKLGITDAERARARREATGGFGTAMELTGAAATSLLTGGAGLAGTAARGAGAAARAGALGRASQLARMTPAGLVERGGAAVERAVAGTLGGGRAARVLAPTARGAVEGFASGVGAVIDQNTLGERDITAEALLGGGVSGALIGGALGGALPVGGAVLTGAAKAPASALEKILGRATGAPGGRASSAAASALRAGDNGMSDLARGYARLLGGDAEAFARTSQRLRTPEGRARLLSDLEQSRSKSAMEIKSAVDQANQLVDEAVRQTMGKGKLRRVDQLMDGIDNAIAPRHAAEHLDAQQRFVERLLDVDEPELMPMAMKKDLRDVRTRIRLAQNKMREGKTGAEAFKAIDDFKRTVDDMARQRRNQYKRGASPEIKELTDLLDQVAAGSRKHLEMENVYGGAARMQKDINAAVKLELGALENLRRTSPSLGKMLERGTEADAATALHLARSYGKTKGMTKVNALDQALDARLNYLRTVKKHHEFGSDVTVERIDAAEMAVKRMREQLRDQAENAAALDDLWKLREVEGGKSPSITAMSTLGPAIGGSLGLATAGPIGAAVGAVAGSVVRPYTMARTLAGVLNTVERFSGRFGASGFVGNLRKAGRKAGKRAREVADDTFTKVRGKRLPVGAAVFGAETLSRKERQKKLDQVAERAATLAGNPDALAKAVQEQMRVVDEVAPGVATEVGVQAMRTVQYLSKHAPATFTPMGGQKLVDPAAADAYRRRIEAAIDPAGVVDLAEQGLLTVEHVETLAELYPRHLEELRRDVAGGLLEAEARGDEMPRWKRLQLGVMLDLPTDMTLDPELLTELQAVHGDTDADEQAEQAEKSGRVLAGGAGKMGTAERAQTAGEKVTSGSARE